MPLILLDFEEKAFMLLIRYPKSDSCPLASGAITLLTAGFYVKIRVSYPVNGYTLF
jgi:hypothetical protein